MAPKNFLCRLHLAEVVFLLGMFGDILHLPGVVTIPSFLPQTSEHRQNHPK